MFTVSCWVLVGVFVCPSVCPTLSWCVSNMLQPEQTRVYAVPTCLWFVCLRNWWFAWASRTHRLSPATGSRAVWMDAGWPLKGSLSKSYQLICMAVILFFQGGFVKQMSHKPGCPAPVKTLIIAGSYIWRNRVQHPSICHHVVFCLSHVEPDCPYAGCCLSIYPPLPQTAAGTVTKTCFGFRG